MMGKDLGGLRLGFPHRWPDLVQQLSDPFYDKGSERQVSLFSWLLASASAWAFAGGVGGHSHKGLVSPPLRRAF
jgi:hypothetical protein